MIKGSEKRKADYPIDSLFLNRWSPRAMSGEQIAEEDLLTLFEAAPLPPTTISPGGFCMRVGTRPIGFCSSIS
jgi:hypothetical protein